MIDAMMINNSYETTHRIHATKTLHILEVRHKQHAWVRALEHGSLFLRSREVRLETTQEKWLAGHFAGSKSSASRKSSSVRWRHVEHLVTRPWLEFGSKLCDPEASDLFHDKKYCLTHRSTVLNNAKTYKFFLFAHRGRHISLTEVTEPRVNYLRTP